MRFYKIEFFTHSTLPENRIRVVERQYSTPGRAQAAAWAMCRAMNKNGKVCELYTVKIL